MWEYTEPLGESLPRRLTSALNYRKTTLKSHVMQPPPLPSPPLLHIQLLCVYTEAHDVSIPPRLTWALNYWQTTLKSHVYQGPPLPPCPLTTHTTTVWKHGFTWFLFISPSTPPFFAYLTYLVARCKMFRLGICAALCGCKFAQTCNLKGDALQTPCL